MKFLQVYDIEVKPHKPGRPNAGALSTFPVDGCFRLAGAKLYTNPARKTLSGGTCTFQSKMDCAFECGNILFAAITNAVNGNRYEDPETTGTGCRCRQLPFQAVSRKCKFIRSNQAANLRFGVLHMILRGHTSNTQMSKLSYQQTAALRFRDTLVSSTSASNQSWSSEYSFGTKHQFHRDKIRISNASFRPFHISTSPSNFTVSDASINIVTRPQYK